MGGGIATDAFQPEDANPLSEEELRDFVRQLEAARGAVLAAVRDLSAEQLERRNDGAPSVRDVLEGIATDAVRLLARLERWPDRDFATFQAVHRMAIQRFVAMEPEDWSDQEIDGERWTTRRVTRSLLEREAAELERLRKLVADLGRGG